MSLFVSGERRFIHLTLLFITADQKSFVQDFIGWCVAAGCQRRHCLRKCDRISSLETTPVISVIMLVCTTTKLFILTSLVFVNQAEAEPCPGKSLQQVILFRSHAAAFCGQILCVTKECIKTCTFLVSKNHGTNLCSQLGDCSDVTDTDFVPNQEGLFPGLSPGLSPPSNHGQACKRCRPI